MNRCIKMLVVMMVLPFLVHAAEVINEGTTPVKIAGAKKEGVIGSGSLPPGKSRVFSENPEMIRHVPSNLYHDEKVKIKIIEDNGKVGWIRSRGGRYHFDKRSRLLDLAATGKRKVKKRVELMDGQALNEGNIPVYVEITFKDKRTSIKKDLLPDTILRIPKETLSVKIRQRNPLRGDEVIKVKVIMPDGKEKIIRNIGGTAHTESLA